MRRNNYPGEGRVRHARADLPVRRQEHGFADAENELFGFEWDRPVRKLGQGFAPGPLNAVNQTVESTACEVRGRFNNCDVYITAPFTWIDPTTANPDTDATVRLNLYVMLQGTEYPVHDQINVDPGTLPDLIVVRGTHPDGTTGDTWRAYALRVRGRPCDGFRVTVTASQSTITAVTFLPGQVSIFAWGEETAESSSTGLEPAAHVIVDGPNPLPVSGTVTSLESPATAGLDLVGTAPSGGVATALAAHAVQREVVVTADSTNTGTVFVSFAANAIAAASTPLGPGDSRRFLIDNTSKLFLNADAAGQTYRVAIT